MLKAKEEETDGLVPGDGNDDDGGGGEGGGEVEVEVEVEVMAVIDVVMEHTCDESLTQTIRNLVAEMRVIVMVMTAQVAGIGGRHSQLSS